ncbi:hypothetical protein Nmel_014844 [Mimus melanotis]
MTALLSFVLKGKLDSHALEQLQHLCVFWKVWGGYVAVAPYCKVLLLHRQFLGVPLHARALYDLDKGMLLLTPSPIHE